MIKQGNGLSRRRMRSITAGFTPNIDLDKARDAARNYARQVRDESNGKYLNYSTSCRRMFPGHNHYVRCVIEYQNARDKTADVYTCKESIEIFMQAHNVNPNGPSFTLFAKHSSGNHCGRRRLTFALAG